MTTTIFLHVCIFNLLLGPSGQHLLSRSFPGTKSSGSLWDSWRYYQGFFYGNMKLIHHIPGDTEFEEGGSHSHLHDSNIQHAEVSTAWETRKGANTAGGGLSLLFWARPTRLQSWGDIRITTKGDREMKSKVCLCVCGRGNCLLEVNPLCLPVRATEPIAKTIHTAYFKALLGMVVLVEQPWTGSQLTQRSSNYLGFLGGWVGRDGQSLSM